jgi:integrase
MGVSVSASRYGFVLLRIYWRGREHWVGTKLKDDGPAGKTRLRMEARASLLTEKLLHGAELHTALLDVLGNCPPHLMPAGTPTASITVKQACDAHLKRLRQWKDRGDARKSLVSKTDTYVKAVIVPFWSGVHLADVTHARLVDFQDHVLGRMRRRRDPETGETVLEPIKVKTARNIIGGHFRAIIKRARAIHGVPVRDPFEGLEWPRTKNVEQPDPFTGEERDRILDFFQRERPRWYPWLNTLFWVGLRQGESTPLTRSDFDLKAGTLSITKSWTEGEENDPKTPRSKRTVQLFPEALAGLAAIPEPVIPEPDALLFVNPAGEIINSKEWPKKSFYPVLRKLGIRVRKFYCTRHTFISELIGRGEDLKAIAEYCGTSAEMIERSYGRWLPKGVERGVRSLRSMSNRVETVRSTENGAGKTGKVAG